MTVASPERVLRDGWSATWPCGQWSDGGAKVTGKLIARVESPDGPLCLRAYPQGADGDWLASLHRVVADLRSAGFTQFPRFVGGPVPVDRRLHDLSTWAAGQAKAADAFAPVELGEIGATIGRLHRAGIDVEPPKPFFAVGREARWEPEFWRDREAQARLARDVVRFAADERLRRDPVGERVVAAFRSVTVKDVVGSTGPPTITHLDIGAEHFLVADDGDVTMVDVDLLDRRGAAVDVTSLVASMARWDVDRGRALLEGYRRHFAITVDEMATAIGLWRNRTIGVIVQRLHAWADGQSWGALPALGPPIPAWCDELDLLGATDAAALAAALLG